MNFASASLLLFLVFLGLESSQTRFESVFSEPQQIEIKRTIRLDKCNNKAYVPIELPANTTGLIYTVQAVGKASFKAAEATLENKVNALSLKHKPSKIADYIVFKGNKTLDYYVIRGKLNIESFNNCGSFKSNGKFRNSKSRADYINIEDPTETLYIGIENAQDARNLRVIIEAVAIVKE